MKLEMDLIRYLLIWCEDNLPDANRTYSTEEIEIPKYAHDQMVFHFELLIDHGYVKATDVSAGQRHKYFIRSLTWEGYDFLYGIMNNNIWSKFKEIAKGMGIEIFKTALPIIAKILANQAGLQNPANI